MHKGFDFTDLFVFEMANNHQGQVDHGRRIIGEMARIATAKGIRGAVKLQFRDLDTMIHPAHRQGSANKHIGRFLSTRLSTDEFSVLVDETRKNGLVTIATPFDEPSVDTLVELGVEVVKIGSCSAADWPLIEKVADFNKPVIFSTGGLTMKQIDDLVSFFDHRRVPHAIMHCVSIYPTPDDRLELNQIAALCRRYPSKVIGFSTHESPEDTDPVQVAVAKGARMFERHVGVQADGITLNAYSSTPAQIERWIDAYQKGRRMCGATERPAATAVEAQALRELHRGVYVRKPVKRGAPLERADVYFAMPCEPGQLSSGEWKEGVVARADLARDEAVMTRTVDVPHDEDRQVLFTAIHTMKGMLNEARIALNTDFRAEFSHHYGVAQFAKFGATIVECINRDYCKKLIIQIPGQRHPTHYHKRKEETFQVLYGVLEMEIEGRRRTLYPGDTQLVQQAVWHEFWTETGAIAEEISTTHFNDDSFYADKTINAVERSKRKTVVNNWGRYQI